MYKEWMPSSTSHIIHPYNFHTKMRSWCCFICLLWLHYCCMAIASSRRSSSNGGECDALLRFRDSFTISKDASEDYYCDYDHSNTSYPKTESWKNGTDCCSWDGVTCHHGAADSVIGLDLSCSWLWGPLDSDSSLFSLPNLRQLNLAGNDFNGSQIPSRLGIFRGLEHLNLSHSGFSGPIPLRTLSNISNLITLDMVSLMLTIEHHGFGWLLRNLTRLRELKLDYVDMSRVSPISLTNISSTLTSLSLHWCSLRGVFPIDIFHLPNLHSLDLYGNSHLTGILPQANWTGPLVSLDLPGTNFHGSIPASLGNLTSLNYLDLSGTAFTGGIPTTLGNLGQLTYLYLGDNNLSGSIDFEMFARLKHLESLFLNGVNVMLQSTGNCSFPRLRRLWLPNCNLTTDQLPYFLSSSNELEWLELSGNGIGGPLTGWLFPYTLRVLDLSSNSITGEIPSSICQLSSLEQLYLSNNSLNGTIPGCLGNLTRLTYLMLADNLLQGQLPQSLANCTSLTYLSVGHNGIHDTFPQWLHAANSLNTIDLQANKFHGVIDVPLPLPLSLRYIILSNNDFSGHFPTNFLLNSSVYLIDLRNNSFDGPLPVPPLDLGYYLVSRNKFNGEVPTQICSSTWLEAIDLSNNRLNGSIPHCFRNLTTSLSVLDLRANNFVGHIPDIFVPNSTLLTVRLSQNQLGGTLPRSMKFCKNLEVLDLSENELEGRFPEWLGTLPNLQVLVLRSNNFHGPVGSSGRYDHPFAMLRIFDISNNNFHGPLPAKYIAKLKAMKNEESNGLSYMNVDDYGYYQDSIVVVMKGMETELEKILTLFTTIDCSSNFFEGEIPKVIGDLKALKGLNLSHNNLSGSIPSSMGNLTNLEWLDLSSNKLGGKIPKGLADIAMLSWLNLSDNRLVGPIPRGTQFDTFGHSFDGNPGLCGRPLPNECGADARKTQPASSHEEEETESGSWIEWRAIPMGYGCGLVFGISAGYVMLETGRPRWLARMIERKLLKKRSRTRKNVTRGNHARRSVRGR